MVASQGDAVSATQHNVTPVSGLVSVMNHDIGNVGRVSDTDNAYVQLYYKEPNYWHYLPAYLFAL